VDVEASLRLPGAAWQMLRDLNVTPKRRHSLLQKVRLAKRIRVGADDRWMGLARWNPRRARRTAAAAARRRRSVVGSGGQGEWIRTPRPPASVPPPPVAGLEAAGRHQDR
jgi:hypothetical protein